MADDEHQDAPQSSSSDFYQPRPTVKNAAVTALQSGAVGVLVSAVQNALGSHNRGAMGILTRSGGTIGFFAAMGGLFAFTDSFVANTREKDDPINGIAAGCAAGFLAGIRARSLPAAVGSCAFLGGAVGVFDTSGRLSGSTLDKASPETLEERRKRFFKQKPSSIPEVQHSTV